MLLYPKKHSVFYITVLLIFFVFAIPAHAHAAGFWSNLMNFFGYDSSAEQEVEERSFTFFPETQAYEAMPGLDSVTNPVSAPLKNSESASLLLVQDSGLVAPLNPLGTIVDEYASGQIFIYTIKQGDNPSAIAKSFGISLNTLLWANDITNARSIKPGDKLVILPISGIQVDVKKGDTVDSIAKKYDGNIQEILAYNGLSPDEPLVAGSTLMVPNGELQSVSAPAGAPSLFSPAPQYPVYAGYYMRPLVGGRKSRGIHGYNGIDLAASRGTPLMASAGGTVLIAKAFGWNGGYGKYVVISHPNGTQTLYAHMDQVFVTVGQALSQGNVIGTVGSTGNSTGPHVHFEIRGAKNPF